MSVSLIAVAALVASLSVVRHKQEEQDGSKGPQPRPSPATVDLDGIRAAGF